MKTGEIYTYALGDPRAKFKSVGEDLLGCSDLVVRFNHVGKLVDDENGSLVYPRFDMEWELVREPVPWQEAIQAWLDGKEVEVVLPYARILQKSGRRLGAYLKTSPENEEAHGFARDAFIDGKWYIK